MRLTGLLLALLFFWTPALAVEPLGTVKADSKFMLSITGPITEETLPAFLAALESTPDARLLKLDSGGGAVYPALAIAWEVHARRLDTRVPEGSVCYSACAFIFMAGNSREITGSGALGVHQISSMEGHLTADLAQFVIGHVLEALHAFGTDQRIITAMLQTGADDVFIIDSQNYQQFDLVRARQPLPPESIWGDAEVAVAARPGDGLTIIPRSSTTADMMKRIYTTSYVFPPDFVGSLGDALVLNGVQLAHSHALEAGFWMVRPQFTTISHYSELRILWGPLGSDPNSKIPYRVSVYQPSSDGTRKHLGTVALSDEGQYVPGMNPELPPPTSTTTGSAAGKVDRYAIQ